LCAPDRHCVLMDLIFNALKLSFAGALIYLDRTHALQMMISRPVVTGPIIGFLAGDVSMGLLMGAIIELLWIRDIPVGSFVPPDETILTVLVASVGVLPLQVSGMKEISLFVYALLIFLPATYLSLQVELALRNANNQLWRLANDAIGRGQENRVALYHWSGAAIAFFAHFMLLLGFLLGGLYFIRLTFPLLPSFLYKALYFTGCVAPVVGVAAALSATRNTKALILFSLIFLLMFALSI